VKSDKREGPVGGSVSKVGEGGGDQIGGYTLPGNVGREKNGCRGGENTVSRYLPWGKGGGGKTSSGGVDPEKSIN